MDSLTQALIGASTFALIKKKDIGNKALLIGAIVATIPDLDVLLKPFFQDIEFITVHRSISHSIIFSIFLASLLTYLTKKLKIGKLGSAKSWWTAYFLAIFTHPILDYFTTYGTKFLSPFSDHLFSLNSIHIFEPIYTIILLVSVSIVFFKPQESKNKVLKIGLALSSSYLLWTLCSKWIAYEKFQNSLYHKDIVVNKSTITPTPLNSILWHGIFKVDSGYYFGTYSLLDKDSNIEFHFVKSNNELLKELNQNKRIAYYLHYCQGFPLIQQEDNLIKIYAIKYGPTNYEGTPKFVYPLCIEKKQEKIEKIWIETKNQYRGPIRNWRQIVKRISQN